MQHLVFWVLSFVVFVQLFKTGVRTERIDLIYTGLFHATIIPVVYINLGGLLPRLANYRYWRLYMVGVILLVVLFSWLNYSFSRTGRNTCCPITFSYPILRFGKWGFFVVYLAITSLLKLSRSWFVVNDLQHRLLQMETEKVQIELKALKAQVNPHFFLIR